ncbi:branched-chain amino acid transport protein AzlC, putative [Luminiphilus syltensis NOR5-1B]|uniref:Branched-chain amino acid transport protein AzlC, putative n=1 Tax=Luminiphilus syltensis NOR5-1B TaxID=565045 RepID=B8KWS9_9GAMM|nr:branched-chain amino acid transport protein AzlC, putative [Luminiphilus syltensis NOR5-1B]
MPAIPFSFVFGLVVANSGIAPLLGWSSTPIMFGGAAQVTLLTLLGQGASVAAATTAALVVTARHLLYSVTLAPRFQNQPRWFRWVGPYLLIDQVFALTLINRDQDPKVFRAYYLASGFTFWLLWMMATGVGLFVGPALPVEWGLKFSAPVMFIGILAVSVSSWEKVLVAGISAGLTVLFAGLPNKMGLLVASLMAICVALILELRKR